MPKDAPNAVSVPGSRHALWLFARLSLVLAAITLTLLVAAAVLAAAHGPGIATALCLCFGLVFALILVPVAVSTVRAAVVMREFPWMPYHASVATSVSQRVKHRMEIWADDDNRGTHWYLKLTLSMASRAMLDSGMYRYVWMAGDPGHGCVVVPAGGGPMVWATRDRLMTRQRTGSFTQVSSAYAPDHARTPDEARVPAPQGRGNALSAPGSRRALLRFARHAAVWWAAGLVAVAVFAVLVATDAPIGAVIGWTYVMIGTAIPLVRTTAAVAGVTWRMSLRPWALYHAAVTVPVSGKVRMEVWPDGEQKAEHRHLRVRSTRATRVQLGSTTYRYVWIAGVPGRRAVLVPAAGGPLVWAGRDEEKPATRHDVPAARARRGSTKTPTVLLAQEARRKARELEREAASGGTPPEGDTVAGGAHPGP